MCENPVGQPIEKHNKASAPIDSSEPPQKLLARLMKAKLGWPNNEMDEHALALFIRNHWDRLSVLAHAIHDEAA